MGERKKHNHAKIVLKKKVKKKFPSFLFSFNFKTIFKNSHNHSLPGFWFLITDNMSQMHFYYSIALSLLEALIRIHLNTIHTSKKN